MTESFQLTQEQLDRIRDLAYEKYVARGGQDGRDLEDWVAAEQEVLACTADATDKLSLAVSCQTQSCTAPAPTKPAKKNLARV